MRRYASADLRLLPDDDPGPGTLVDPDDDDDIMNKKKTTTPPPPPPHAPTKKKKSPAALAPWIAKRMGGSCRRRVVIPHTSSSSSVSLWSGDAPSLPEDPAAPPGGSTPPTDLIITEWFCRRDACIAVVMILLVTPLCLCRSLKSLGFASFVSCAIFVGFIGILMGKLANEVVGEGKHLPPLRLLPDTEVGEGGGN